MNEPVAVFAVDPGKTTGVAWGVFRIRKTTGATLARGEGMDSAQVESGTDLWSAARVVDLFDEFVAALGGQLEPVLVIEDFILRPQKANADRDMLSPVRLTGLIEGMVWERFAGPVCTIYQMPSEAKGFATNVRMERWGVKTWGGGRHAKDAWRHIAVYLAKEAQKRDREAREGQKGKS